MQKAFDSILAELLNDMSVRQLCSFHFRPVILLAVSGGVDSMTMAELFRNTSVNVGFAVAHCNFSLRGEESDADEALVTAWSERNGVSLHKKSFDTSAYAEENGISIEMAARDLRYGWFSSLCRENGYAALAVAHNANDNAETLFLNLLRGTGIKGLSGMGTVSSMPDGSGLLLRPLLGFSRKQIEGYAFSNGVKYRDDRTNAETEYKRNKIRNLVFPLFEEINPSFIRTLNREMSWFSQIKDIADEYYLSRKDSFYCSSRIDIRRLKENPNWEYLLYRVLDELGFNPAVTSSVTDLLKSGRTVSGKKFSSGGNMIITATDALLLYPEKVKQEGYAIPCSGRRGTLPPVLFDKLSSSSPTMTIRGPGDYFFNGVSFSVSVRKWSGKDSPKVTKGTILFDRSAMDFPFLCRRWSEGDWIQPLGMKGKKKISDLFTDLKYSIVDKKNSVMLINPSSADRSDQRMCRHVSAVLGERIDDSLKVKRETEEVIIIDKLP